MGILAVLLAALGGFATGAAWYMTFAKPWVADVGIKTDENGKPEGGSAFPFVVAGIAMVLVAGMMRHTFAMAGVDGFFASLIGGLGIGLFFIAPWIAMNYAYSMRPLRLALIDGGYAVVSPAVVGGILGLF